MGKASHAQVSFAGGEFSPDLEGRIDIEKYQSAVRTLTNFIPTVQGPAVKRSGTRYVKPIYDEANTARLVRFEYSTEDAYVLEFSNQRLRFYRENGGVLEGTVAITAVVNGTPMRVTAPGHGYAIGDQVFVSGTTIAAINDTYYRVSQVIGNDLELEGTTPVGGGGAGGTVARVYTLQSPYLVADLPNLRWAQSADVLYLTCKGYAPRQLVRGATHTSWTLSLFSTKAPAFAQENLSKTDYMVASGTTGTVNLYSTGGHFVSGHVGGFVKLAEDLEGTYPEWRANGRFSYSITDPHDYWSYYNVSGSSFPQVGGENSYAHYQGRLYRITGTFNRDYSGPVPPTHEDGRQQDGQVDWLYINSGYGWVLITAVADAYRATGVVQRELGRTVWSTERTPSAISHSGGTATFTFAVSHGFLVGDTVFVRGTSITAINNRTYVITSITSTTFTVVTGNSGSGSGGTVIRVKSVSTTTTAYRAERTTRWAFSAWAEQDSKFGGGGASDYVRGYPTDVGFQDDRLWFSSTEADPEGMWASRTARYDDFLLTDEDDGSLALTLQARVLNKIEWMAPSRRMVVGTAGGEFLLTTEGDAAITAGNVSAPQHSVWGVKRLAPALIGSEVLFCQRSGRRIVEYSFDFGRDSYAGSDLSIFAAHILSGIVAEIIWSQEPDRLLWCRLEDGGLAALTYHREQQALAWQLHVIGGTGVAVESIASIPHPDGDRDQVWMVVRRTINGQTRRYVEYLEREFSGTLAEAFYVDAGATYSGAPASTILTLWHLIGEAVAVLADGGVVSGLVVSSTGQITLPAAASTVHVGLPYTAVLETLEIEAGGRDGVAQGKIKRITNLVVRLRDTAGRLWYGPSASALDPVTSATLFNGDTEILPFPSGYSQSARVRLEHADPTPCTVIALYPQLVTEDR